MTETKHRLLVAGRGIGSVSGGTSAAAIGLFLADGLPLRPVLIECGLLLACMVLAAWCHVALRRQSRRSGHLRPSELPGLAWVLLAGKPYREQARAILRRRGQVFRHDAGPPAGVPRTAVTVTVRHAYGWDRHHGGA